MTAIARPAKKARTSNAGHDKALADIAGIEKRLIATSSTDLNPLVDLIDIFSQQAGDTASSKAAARCLQLRVASAHSLHNVFASLIRQGRLIGKVRLDEGNSALAAVREWTKVRWNGYVDKLCALLGDKDAGLAIPALNILMSLLRTTSEHLTALQNPVAYTFDLATWRKITHGLLAADMPVQTEVLEEFSTRYLNQYDDIRFYFLRSVKGIVENVTAAEPLKGSLMQLLESITTMPSHEVDLNQYWAGRPAATASKVMQSNLKKMKKANRKRKRADINEDDGLNTSTGIFDDTESSDDDDTSASLVAAAQLKAKVGQHELLSIAEHRRVFASAWQAFLGLQLNEDDLKRVLVMLHRQVMPHLTEPGMLIDFLSDCCDSGGTVALLALNGLFTLITKHRLDYPNFYQNLYRLLDNEVMHVRYRARFLHMLDLFLQSTNLPTALVASFIKKLARLSLGAPPAAIISVVPLIYNMLKRHTACMVLIHGNVGHDVQDQYQDPFDEIERDPLRTKAIDSSLWELASLRHHYLANISTLAKIFEEAFTKPSYDLEDFFDHAYSTLFETEANRKFKRAPAMRAAMKVSDLQYLFPAPGLVNFTEQGEEAELRLDASADIVGKMWRFG